MRAPHGTDWPQPWQIRHVAVTGSTNADLTAHAADTPDRSVLITDEQRIGRGRLGRTWQAPPGSALLMSLLLRPTAVPPAQRGWIGAILGVAAVTAIRERTGLTAALKWPNDVLINGHKVGGILAEMAGDALVVGIGLNLTVARADLPRADATSLLLAGADPETLDRDALAADILTALDPVLQRWYEAAGDVQAAGIREQYVAACATIGREVRVELPSGDSVIGRATDVRADGALEVALPTGGSRSFLAGDVHHLRMSS